MTRNPWSATALASVTLAAAAIGQIRPPADTRPDSPVVSPSPPAIERNAPPPAPTSYSLYREQTSRELFAACDLNGDDRITTLEALKTLQGLDRERFRTFDLNNDGRIQFNEFDHHFRNRVRYGGQLVITSVALERLPKRASEERTVEPVLMTFFGGVDKDANDRIDLGEWKVVGSLLDNDPEAAFYRLDKDLSGNLTVNELEPMLETITLLDRTRARANAAKRQLRPLPDALRIADLDTDSLIDAGELARALGRIHPSLLRHATRILAAADANDDGHLDAFELQAALAVRRGR